MDALGVVCSQYWLQPKPEKGFNTHLAIMKVALYQLKKVRPDEVWVLNLFFAIAFDLQRSLFVLTMTNNAKLAMHKPFDVNLVTKLWRTFTSFQILEIKIPKYIKLVELVVQIIDYVEDECCFSTLTFMKTKLRNRSTMHLKLVIHMFNQKFFTLKTFPFVVTIQN